MVTEMLSHLVTEARDAHRAAEEVYNQTWSAYLEARDAYWVWDDDSQTWDIPDDEDLVDDQVRDSYYRSQGIYHLAAQAYNRTWAAYNQAVLAVEAANKEVEKMTTRQVRVLYEGHRKYQEVMIRFEPEERAIPLLPVWGDFYWGYVGADTTNLAYALLKDATGDVGLAHRHYEDYACILAHLTDHWIIPQQDILDWLESMEGPEQFEET